MVYMMPSTFTNITIPQWDFLFTTFGKNMKRDVPMARFTAARVGGSAEGLLVTESVESLSEVVSTLWDKDIPFMVLGAGSNILISDYGIRGVVILNRAKENTIDDKNLTVWAGSGASFGQIARKVSARGYSGLEWATGIPGTIGGAVFGNAGAHGGDVAGIFNVADILHRVRGKEKWTVEQMEYSYRSSKLKRDLIDAVILSACFNFEKSSSGSTKILVEKIAIRRKKTQPTGASMGSMFKNPPGDYAGRLIELAGLKGTRIGGAFISPVHANFFVNDEETKARDIYELIQLAQKTVLDEFNIELDLEIELIGDWEAYSEHR
jgi:UDP-N-acetylmuramate dehydrogenase